MKATLSTLHHWLAVIANRNQAFSIRRNGTHHENLVPSHRMSNIFTYVRVALATTGVHSIVNMISVIRSNVLHY